MQLMRSYETSGTVCHRSKDLNLRTIRCPRFVLPPFVSCQISAFVYKIAVFGAQFFTAVISQ